MASFSRSRSCVGVGLGWSLALALGACGATVSHPALPAAKASRPVPATSPTEEPQHGTFRRDGAVSSYVSSPWGFSTASYVLEGPDGLVAIDTQFLPSATEEMIARAEAATKKRFVLAIVLHANPDKFNGTATFQRHGVKVVTSAQVVAQLPDVHEKRVRAFYDRYAPDYPAALPAPDVFGDRSTTLRAAGMTLTLHVLGAGCSEHHVVVEHSQNLFVGDLVANEAHSWLEIGKTDAWLKRLVELRALKPSRIFPGRGAPGPASLLDDEETYLKTVIALVAAEKPSERTQDAAREAALARVEGALLAAYPRHHFPVFLKIGLPAEWARQAVDSRR